MIVSLHPFSLALHRSHLFDLSSKPTNLIEDTVLKFSEIAKDQVSSIYPSKMYQASGEAEIDNHNNAIIIDENCTRSYFA